MLQLVHAIYSTSLPAQTGSYRSFGQARKPPTQPWKVMACQDTQKLIVTGQSLQHCRDFFIGVGSYSVELEHVILV
jgi:hypothetical protein